MRLRSSGVELKRVFAALSLLAATGCGKVSLDMDNVAPSLPVPSIKLSKAAEFVAASRQNDKSINGYVVNTSAGAVVSKLEVTTPNGFKVYSTVQGSLISEEKQVAEATAAAKR